MSGSEMPLAAIDLTGTVTREQYNAMGRILAPTLDAHGRRQGWCSERHAYFHGIMPEYDYYEDGYFVPVAEGDYAEDYNYAAKTALVRSRILYWVDRQQVTLADANAIFKGCGLPEFDPANVIEGPFCRGCGRVHDDEPRIPETELSTPTYTG